VREAARVVLVVDVARRGADEDERAEALGEAFNLGSPTPFTFAEAGALLAELSGRTPLEVRLPVRWRYDHNPAKARTWIGYTPRGDLPAMMRSAWAFKRGEHDGYDWTGFAAPY